MMEDSIQNAYSGGCSSAQTEMRNGFVEQTQILTQLSKELDDYFSLRSIRDGN